MDALIVAGQTAAEYAGYRAVEPVALAAAAAAFYCARDERPCATRARGWKTVSAQAELRAIPDTHFTSIKEHVGTGRPGDDRRAGPALMAMRAGNRAERRSTPATARC